MHTAYATAYLCPTKTVFGHFAKLIEEDNQQQLQTEITNLNGILQEVHWRDETTYLSVVDDLATITHTNQTCD